MRDFRDAAFWPLECKVLYPDVNNLASLWVELNPLNQDPRLRLVLASLVGPTLACLERDVLHLRRLSDIATARRVGEKQGYRCHEGEYLHPNHGAPCPSNGSGVRRPRESGVMPCGHRCSCGTR